MNLINVNGQQVAFQTHGKGRPLVFLHGFCENKEIWETFTSTFDEFKLILIDLPGFGESGLPSDLSIDKMADAVKHVLDALKITSATIIGHSMGGYVALSFLEKWKSCVDALVLFHSHALPDNEDKKKKRQQHIRFIEKNGHQLYLKQLFSFLFARKFSGSNAFLMEKLIHTANKLPSANIIAALYAMMNRPDRSEILDKLEIPVLFIIGSEDITVFPEQSMAHAHYPEVSVIKILKGVNHMGMFEDRKNSTRALKEFLEFCSTHDLSKHPGH